MGSRLDFLGLAVLVRCLVVLWCNFLDAALLGRGGSGDGRLFHVFFVIVLFLFLLLFFSSGRVGLFNVSVGPRGTTGDTYVPQQERGQARLGRLGAVLFVLLILVIFPLELLVVVIAVVLGTMIRNNGDRLLRCFRCVQRRIISGRSHWGCERERGGWSMSW
ncbi:hypothetical protein C8R44DRAFT_757208 [Mycena epipterygia]|nr:hypothetical protein C8R44DRAFT_757208 [Mycena epipterygia]